MLMVVGVVDEDGPPVCGDGMALAISEGEYSICDQGEVPRVDSEGGAETVPDEDTDPAREGGW